MANLTSNDELLTRGIESVTPRADADAKQKSGKPMRLYFGIEPTGAQINVGHSVPLLKMRGFQDAGHEVILLIGSLTAMIGDATGKDE
ncbi:MAG TPA: tyrosine--tRNA ligase, partial [Candidatus Peribacteria bacterium]|nr:tyrosine--tRNA ligase [Candidatus Peribacteria bacterium]